jgi:hypothetical protein
MWLWWLARGCVKFYVVALFEFTLSDFKASERGHFCFGRIHSFRSCANVPHAILAQ